MRLIDADALKEFIGVGYWEIPSEICFSGLDVINILNAAPTIYPVKNGEWKVVPICKTLYWECSICGAGVNTQTKYCPHCGARNETVVV